MTDKYMKNFQLSLGDLMLKGKTNGVPEPLRVIIKKYQDRLPNRPVNLEGLAAAIGENMGCEIDIKDTNLPAGCSGKITKTSKGYSVEIDKEDIPTRRRFTLAHELAHLILHRDQIGDGITENAMLRSHLSNPLEWEANSLAAAILMPAYVMAALDDLSSKDPQADKIDDLVETFARFCQVSKSAMRIRFGMYTN